MKIIIGLTLALTLPALMPHAPEDNVHINKIQVIGSHNSYKSRIDPVLYKMLQQRDSAGMSKIDYEHISLTAQLDMGLENLEIDVYADEKGGKFAHPKGLEWAPGQAPYDPQGLMQQPGFKVLHIPDIDFRNDNLTLRNVLHELRTWSEKHPDHKPVFITMEAKDQGMRGNDMTVVDKFSARTFDQLDSTIRADLGNEHLITPDQVKGNYSTLNEAVTHDHWPTLKEARGKFLILLDDHAAKRDLYIQGHPSLAGRVLFVNAEPGTPEAAWMIRNNAKDTSINTLVKEGYIIRTRADSDTKEARLNDKTFFEAACNSGAQVITTDYYLKSTHFKSDYIVYFEGKDKYFRLNPAFNK